MASVSSVTGRLIVKTAMTELLMTCRRQGKDYNVAVQNK